jgi:hypothetical protein
MRRFILVGLAIVLSAVTGVVMADRASAHDICIHNGDAGQYDTACVTANHFTLTAHDGECDNTPVYVNFAVAATGTTLHRRDVPNGCGNTKSWGMLSPITGYMLCEDRSGSDYCTGWHGT